ncbi:DUF1127 domain-containing protein [Oceanomicrobium pacificus]|nr:hypothetical protein [Oceanomicrobium pacificus]
MAQILSAPADCQTSQPPLSLTGLTRWLRLSAALWGERRALGTLDDARLKDLGLSNAAASQEAARPFWMHPNFR